ncbi:MAG: hypothetical protein LBP75_10120 [Planctomycetota bacterium]|jgi:hypothetical protein|nr:hypothetical protein [Planctomycetota bacterium]
MPIQPEDFPLFSGLDAATARAGLRKLETYLHDFLAANDIVEWFADPVCLLRIVERVEKRRVYFHIFHDMQMGELNEAALYAFWILKLCPFGIAGKDGGAFNALIAARIFTGAVRAAAQSHGKSTTFTRELVEKLIYSFRYRDLSKEALMLMADGFISA